MIRTVAHPLQEILEGFGQLGRLQSNIYFSLRDEHLLWRPAGSGRRLPVSAEEVHQSLPSAKEEPERQPTVNRFWSSRLCLEERSAPTMAEHHDQTPAHVGRGVACSKSLQPTGPELQLRLDQNHISIYREFVSHNTNPCFSHTTVQNLRCRGINDAN